MSGLDLLANALSALWLAAEIRQVARSRRVVATIRDQGTFAGMWWTLAAAVAVANVLAGWFHAQLPALDLSPWVQDAGLGLMVAGIGVRWYAMGYLGRYFTVRVAVQADQPLIDAGPYRWVRHPSYTGAWLAFVGLGLMTRTWPSLAVWVILPLVALLRRVRVEECVLSDHFGERYAAYQRRTWRLIPWLF